MFVFYDFETTGTSPAFDQPLQFAAILTDNDLNPVESIDIRCRLAPHVLPSPWAMAVTGIRPETLNDPTLPTWFEFTKTLSELIKRWGPATWTGYNSISFDEEMMRQTLYQNLHPSPYLTQLGGNDRMDMMKVVYSTWVVANDALNWPPDDNGRTSFKLDRLAPANGFEHHDAHDALGDVEATIHIARLVRDRAPNLWTQALRNRSKNQVNALLESGQVLNLVERFGAAPPRSYLGAYAGRSSDNPNNVGFIDLQMVDPVDLAQQGSDAVANAVSASPKQIRTVTVNKFPSLFVADNVDLEVSDRAKSLVGMVGFHQQVGDALAGRFADRETPEHVEQQIYSGFYSRSDQRLLDQFQVADWERRAGMITEFSDRRLHWLGQRVIYNNQPDLLDNDGRSMWEDIVRDRWTSDDPSVPWMTFAKVQQQLDEIVASGAMKADRLKLLIDYYDERWADTKQKLSEKTSSKSQVHR